MEEFVTVSVRIKPCLSEELSNTSLQVIDKDSAVLAVSDKSQIYTFDNIFTDDEKQEHVYNKSVKPLVQKVKAGYNCTVFAYGQTGTGKTYTIGTFPTAEDEDAGLISRALKEFFLNNEESSLEISISFIEIYNEKVFDLLATDKTSPLSLKGFTVQQLKLDVNTVFEALQHLKHGSSKRHTGGTKQNLSSSRSHAVFSIHCHTKKSEKETVAKLNLVDLAGSESVKKTGNQGSSFHEGININKGLLSLGQVMTALSTNSSHIPYRQSVITTILQDSLNKKNYISLIACVSSNTENLTETMQTLDFSSRMKKMKNKPEINELISQYKKDNLRMVANSVGKFQTPLKRLNVSETPFTRHRSTLTTQHVNVPRLFAPHVAPDLAQQNFSPVLRKYMHAMENSIMNKLENVIENTLKRQVKARSREDKENLKRKKILYNAVEESLILTNEEQVDISSPNTSNVETPVSVSDQENSIIYHANDSEEALTDIVNANNMHTPRDDNSPLFTKESNSPLDDFVFKVPAPKQKSTKASNDVRRRSQRLQIKLNSSNLENTVRRKSVRLEMKNRTNHAKENVSPDVTRRRSVRLLKMKETEEIKTPYSRCSNCVKKSVAMKRVLKDVENSPVTKRTNQVLEILNNGTVKELGSLHTVGIKTAEKILLFRQLHGNFEKISDIAKMPSWSKKKYDKFLADNFLRG